MLLNPPQLLDAEEKYLNTKRKGQKMQDFKQHWLIHIKLLCLFIIDSVLNLGTNPEECRYFNLIMSFHVPSEYDSMS